MRTRRSWRNQNRLFRELGGTPVPFPKPKFECDPAITAGFAQAAKEEAEKLRARKLKKKGVFGMTPNAEPSGATRKTGETA